MSGELAKLVAAAHLARLARDHGRDAIRHARIIRSPEKAYYLARAAARAAKRALALARPDEIEALTSI